MSTQYDDIGASFDEMHEIPAANLCDYNFQAAVAPYVKGAKVLDLACGTGHYANLMLEMGAESVVGVDISSVMIDAAKANYASDKLSFCVGDCSQPTKVESGPFDLVIGAWLLNYAPSGLKMADMFRNIAMNLTDQGRFVGITPHPSEEPMSFVQKAAEVRPVQYGNVTVFPTGEVEDGITVEVVTVTRSKTIEFDCFHLRMSVYEASAREGGMKGTLEWKPTLLPEGSEELWRSYIQVPHFGLMVVSKA